MAKAFLPKSEIVSYEDRIHGPNPHSKFFYTNEIPHNIDWKCCLGNTLSLSELKPSSKMRLTPTSPFQNSIFFESTYSNEKQQFLRIFCTQFLSSDVVANWTILSKFKWHLASCKRSTMATGIVRIACHRLQYVTDQFAAIKLASQPVIFCL